MSETSEKMGRCFSEVHECRGSPSELKIADAIDRLAADLAGIKEKADALSPEDVAHFVDSEKAWVAMIENQRDAAIRERNEARAEVERLRQAVGLATTAVGDMVIDVENPIGMMQRVVAEVERLKAELAARQAANSSKISNSSPADPPPAAPAAGWLTQEERRILEAHVQSLRDQRRAMERGGQTLGYSADSCGLKREADAIDAILARAGSPPEQTAALWLTEKERAVVEQIASMIEQWFHMAWSDTDEKRCAVLRSILARAGSPPVVEVPAIDEWDAPARVEAMAYRAAMDKAGVPWKEVGRE